jgi:molybdopterin synthase sulfur carrier subunit
MIKAMKVYRVVDLSSILRQTLVMAKVIFTANLRRHVDCSAAEVDGATVREVLERVFAGNERIRGYVLDDQAALRKHMTIIVDGHSVRDRLQLSDPVNAASEIYVLQALSGG